ncbi:hypothetical protein KCP73_20710 [Salmonella enterica subsp. enterica]|nr:hypothetical protein KCP73_20710 [Salmonella enterica subsp. enterica]
MLALPAAPGRRNIHKSAGIRSSNGRNFSHPATAHLRIAISHQRNPDHILIIANTVCGSTAPIIVARNPPVGIRCKIYQNVRVAAGKIFTTRAANGTEIWMPDRESSGTATMNGPMQTYAGKTDCWFDSHTLESPASSSRRSNNAILRTGDFSRKYFNGRLLSSDGASRTHSSQRRTEALKFSSPASPRPICSLAPAPLIYIG